MRKWQIVLKIFLQKIFQATDHGRPQKRLQADISLQKDNGNLAKSDAEKTETLAAHLSDIFKPFARNVMQEKKRILL